MILKSIQCLHEKLDFKGYIDKKEKREPRILQLSPTSPEPSDVYTVNKVDTRIKAQARRVPWWLSGLRCHCCGSGYCCSSGSIAGLETSTCCGHGKKKKKKKKTHEQDRMSCGNSRNIPGAFRQSDTLSLSVDIQEGEKNHYQVVELIVSMKFLQISKKTEGSFQAS